MNTFEHSKPHPPSEGQPITRKLAKMVLKLLVSDSGYTKGWQQSPGIYICDISFIIKKKKIEPVEPENKKTYKGITYVLTLCSGSEGH